MTSIEIKEDLIPELKGQSAIVTGGSSGIGLAAAKLLVSKGARVCILDINPPEPQRWFIENDCEFVHCDVTSWSDLHQAFLRMGNVDMVFANAGISEDKSFFQDVIGRNGELQEPSYEILDVNVRAVFNTVKLAWSTMRRQESGGSIVITTSATAYAPEQSLPIYSAAKLALVGLVRATRSIMIRENVRINAVAPAATITNLLPKVLAEPIISAGLPVSSSHFVARALVFSATATETRRVEAYGKENETHNQRDGPWNGRIIFTLGERYTELEEGIADSRKAWFGEDNTNLTRMQQAATDFRP